MLKQPISEAMKGGYERLSDWIVNGGSLIFVWMALICIDCTSTRADAQTKFRTSMIEAYDAVLKSQLQRRHHWSNVAPMLYRR